MQSTPAPRPSAAAASLLLLLLAACGGAGGGAEAAAKGDPSLSLPGWSLERAASVGGPEAPPEQTLFGVIGVSEDTEGRFWVLNQGDKRILAFDSTGKFLRAIGRTGKGPGEFTGPVALAARGSDGLFVLDAVNGRLNRFRRSDGSFLGDLNLVEKGFAMRRMDVTPDGAVFVEVDRPQLLTGASGSQPFVVRVDTVTGAHTRIATLDTTSRIQTSRKSGTGSLIQVMDRPFAPRPVWAADPRGGVFFGNGSVFEVYRTEGEGQPRRVAVRGQGEAQPVTQLDRDAFLSIANRREMEDQFDFPETKPFYNDLRADAEGRLWVQTPREDGARAWEIFERDGRKAGELLLPADAYLRAISRGSVYVLRYDEDDVETLERWRLVRR